jgi:hypothetical protein
LKVKIDRSAKEELIRLIRKYKRESTTIIGSERESDTAVLHDMDPSIPKFISADFGIKMIFAYYLGFLPFMRIPLLIKNFQKGSIHWDYTIPYDVFSAPYMTRDYLHMKLIEARERPLTMYPYIAFIILSNWAINPMLAHL